MKHVSLLNNSILLLNILFQGESVNSVQMPAKAVANLVANADAFIAAASDFISSNTLPNVFYLVLVRDSFKNVYTNDDNEDLKRFIEKLIWTCRIDDPSAVKLIKWAIFFNLERNLISQWLNFSCDRIIIEESRKHCDDWSCKLVQGLENQYPVAWDIVVSELLKDSACDSLSRVLGFTSFTTQFQIFEKLNHPKAEIRMEAIKYIANHAEDVKVSFVFPLIYLVRICVTKRNFPSLRS